MKFRSSIAALHAALFCLVLAVSPAGSGSMMLMGVGKPTAAGGGFSLVFNSSALSGAALSGTTYDYGTLAYSAGATRIIVANIWAGSGTPTITGITIGGVALAQVSSAYATTGGNSSDVWQSSAPLAGSSGDVQVTYSNALTFTSSVAIYSLTTATPTAFDHNGTTSGTGTVASSIIVPSGGGGLVVTANVNGNAATVTGATLDVDTHPGGFDHWFGHMTSTGTVSVSASYGTSGNYLSLVSWGP